MKKIISILLLFLFCFSIILYSTLTYHEKVQKQQLEYTTHMYLRVYETIYTEKKRLANVFFSGIKHLTDLENQMYKVKYAKDPQEIDQIRNSIYETLKPRYDMNKNNGYDKIHIHLPNNTSFLRMHEPTIYGDDLSKIRPSVIYVNTHLKPTETFEEGKFSNNLRFVFPLFKNKEHVGSIEIAFLPSSITSAIMQHYYVLSNFYINQSVADRKHIQTSLSYYKPSHHKGYYYDKEVLNVLKNISRKDISQLKPKKNTTDKIREAGISKTASSIYDENIKAIFTIIPIVNQITNENIAFLTVRSKSKNLVTSNNYIYTIVVFEFIFLLFIFAFFYVLYQQKEKLKLTVEKQTKRLVKLNNDLEDLVFDRTKKLHDFLKASSDFAWELDHTLTYTYLSDEIEDVMGYKPYELLGKTPFDFISSKEKEKMSQDIKNLATQQQLFRGLELDMLNKEGKTIPLLINGIPIFDKQNTCIGFRGTGRDITLQKDMEQDLKNKEIILLEQSKMAAMGEMLENIAHQWRQPLSVITVSASDVQMRKEFDKLDDEYLLSSLKNIEDSAQHLSQTIDDFRNFYKTDTSAKKFDLKKAVDKSINLLYSKLHNRNIKVVVQFDSTFVLGFENEIVQVIMNILNNAKDALEESSQEDKVIIISLELNKDTIVLSIQDNASGIIETIKDQIFDHKFTTKDPTKGTGIGLYMSKLIMEKSKGTIQAENRNFQYENKEYSGACFLLTFKKEI